MSPPSAGSVFFCRVKPRSVHSDLLNNVTQKPWPVRVAFFCDPDGELIELLEDKAGYN